VALVCPETNERVLRTFDMAGVTGILTLYPSREEALAALASTGRAASRNRASARGSR